MFPLRTCACVPCPSAGDVVLPRPLPAVLLWRVPRCCPRLSSLVPGLGSWAAPPPGSAGDPGHGGLDRGPPRGRLREPVGAEPSAWALAALPARRPPGPWPLQACRPLASARSGLQPRVSGSVEVASDTHVRRRGPGLVRGRGASPASQAAGAQPGPASCTQGVPGRRTGSSKRLPSVRRAELASSGTAAPGARASKATGLSRLHGHRHLPEPSAGVAGHHSRRLCREPGLCPVARRPLPRGTTCMCVMGPGAPSLSPRLVLAPKPELSFAGRSNRETVRHSASCASVTCGRRAGRGVALAGARPAVPVRAGESRPGLAAGPLSSKAAVLPLQVHLQTW